MPSPDRPLVVLNADTFVAGATGPRPEPTGPTSATKDDMIAEIRGKIGDGRVLDAFRDVDRADFVPDSRRSVAYAKAGIELSETAVMSFPTMVARTTALLELKGEERVLEIGAGSGYGAAILSRLAREVHTVEIDPKLAASAEARLRNLGFDNVTVHKGDGTQALPGQPPFDAILVTAGAKDIPQALLDQLAEGGRMVIPLGDPQEGQMLTLIEKDGKGFIDVTSLNTVFFRPLETQVPAPAPTAE